MQRSLTLHSVLSPLLALGSILDVLNVVRLGLINQRISVSAFRSRKSGGVMFPTVLFVWVEEEARRKHDDLQ